MAQIKSSITINRPIEEVFAFVADPSNDVNWRSDVVESKVTSGSLGVGATFQFASEFMGRKIETIGEMTAYDSPKRFAWKSKKSPIPVSAVTTFEAVADGTLVVDAADFEPGGFFKIAEPLLIKQAQSAAEKDMKKLKELLEK